ncbi:ExeA family protein [Alteromonas confluentis]|mgnify:CR=1 FL=1|uniref:AAA family ATPase n=1 Tax=Alteromonas confluentis TaxID=1656094 RepID=A0A1E7Z6A0_9ALTE|nr:AAA family ATPase [Alteromonas confluentis]OFC69058.1 AAA family ATPase [Alteromonas confluentis]
MYLNYFGLTDNPFSIAPNPDYLYMSPRHKEALAHLTFGLRESGGFVMLTGEVGTGKTTVSRKLLQQLPDNTQVAMILNPTLSALELLATVCDELGIAYDADKASLKYFTDRILAKLADNHQAGVNTVLMIDEAQHLMPEVLEQLRLLTNLETNREKLLKVVLIGQPELQQLLKRNELRQLAQRITARYHLLPLTAPEVSSYVAHRLSVANGDISIFSPQALKAIHQITGGIPRVINLLCDRALTLSFTKQHAVVKKPIFLAAAEQILGDDVVSQRIQSQRKWMLGTAFVLALLVGFGIGRLYV